MQQGLHSLSRQQYDRAVNPLTWLKSRQALRPMLRLVLQTVLLAAALAATHQHPSSRDTVYRTGTSVCRAHQQPLPTAKLQLIHY
jgi:hypothetical protein